MLSYEFIKADKELFAVFQTVYSQADIEMWFSWEERLNDTRWSDDCYFLCREGEKLGGALIADAKVMYAFTVPQFCDGHLFWRLVLDKAKELTTKTELSFNGVLERDVDILQNLGLRVRRARQIMCRPTEALRYILPGDVRIETAREEDIPELAEALHRSYAGGISFEIFGEESVEMIIADMERLFAQNKATGTVEQFAAARRVTDGAIVGACAAGINPGMPNRFASIAEVFVLPEYRRRGIAEALIKHSVTAAHATAPVMKLHVLVNNPAAALYRKLGFIAGPKFTDMKYIL